MIEVEIKLPISEADTIRGKLLGLGFRESDGCRSTMYILTTPGTL